MVRSKLGQRLGVLIILALGAVATAWVWYTALTEGYYYRKAAFLFPCLAVFGLAEILFRSTWTSFGLSTEWSRRRAFANSRQPGRWCSFWRWLRGSGTVFWSHFEMGTARRKTSHRSRKMFSPQMPFV
jgi:hypothetical protein